MRWFGLFEPRHVGAEAHSEGGDEDIPPETVEEAQKEIKGDASLGGISKKNMELRNSGN